MQRGAEATAEEAEFTAEVCVFEGEIEVVLGGEGEGCEVEAFLIFFVLRNPSPFRRCRNPPTPSPGGCRGDCCSTCRNGVGHWLSAHGSTCVWPNVYAGLLRVCVTK